MDTKDSVLKGCELVCFEGQRTDWVSCRLPTDEQKVCYGYRQFRAGLEEAIRRITNAEFAALGSLGIERMTEPQVLCFVSYLREGFKEEPND